MSTPSTGIPPTTPSLTLMPNQRRSWLGRNWGKLLAAAFLGRVLFAAAILCLVVGAIRGSDVAKEAMARAQSNALLAQHLGNPMSEGWFVGGSTNVQPAATGRDRKTQLGLLVQTHDRDFIHSAACQIQPPVGRCHHVADHAAAGGDRLRIEAFRFGIEVNQSIGLHS
jgi:hypothetical protein